MMTMSGCGGTRRWVMLRHSSAADVSFLTNTYLSVCAGAGFLAIEDREGVQLVGPLR